MDLNSLKLFTAVAETGSFTQASQVSGMPVATISRKVSELEASLNMRLLERSTRHIRLTEAGETMLKHAVKGFAEIEVGEQALTYHQQSMRGKIRISMPPGFAPFQHVINKFQSQFPGALIEENIEVKKLDLIQSDIDVALRVGDVIQQSIVSRKLTEYRHLLVASPEYINTRGPIGHPDDLKNLRCASWNTISDKNEWMLGAESFPIKPYLKVNDLNYLKSQAIDGECITELPPFTVSSEIKNGTLTQVLKHYPMPMQEVHLIYPSRKQVSAVIRAFIDFSIKEAQNWDWK